MSTILIAEDDQLLSEMYSLKLKNEGYTVLTAMDGATALALAKEKHPDLILLDVIMPKMDGFAVLEAVRQEAGIQKTPVILLTNLGQDQDRERGKQLGATDYLVKANNTPGQIVEKVKALLKK